MSLIGGFGQAPAVGALLLALAPCLPACGRAKDVVNHRSIGSLIGRSAPEDHSGNDSGPPPEQTANASAEQTDTGPAFAVQDGSASRSIYDQSRRQPTPGVFFQADERLTDLFDSRGESQLCFPAALAFQLDFQREHREPRIESLPDLAAGMSGGSERPVHQIRQVVDLCRTDIETGTTMPQGAHCIDRIYRAANLDPEITVQGIDAKWVAYGMFPRSAAALKGAASAAGIREAVTAGHSVIALVGFYSRTGSGAWHRVRGHFISIAGFGYQEAWAEAKMTLQIVNPASAYSDSAEAERYDSVRLIQSAPEGFPNLPEGAEYHLAGPSLPDPKIYLVVLESVMGFATTAPESRD